MIETGWRAAASWLRAASPSICALLLVAAAVLSAASISGLGTARTSVVALTLASCAHLAASRASSPSIALTLGATVAAAIWLTAAPPLSDDIYRYLLDGETSARGLNPFAYAPASPKVSDLVATLPGAVNHPELPTIYPPAAQGLFALHARFGGGDRSWRLLLSLAVVAAAMVANRRAGSVGNVKLGTFVATHPLTVISAAGNGHLDALAPLVVFGVLLAVERGRALVIGAWIALGAALKLLPLLLLAALPGRFGARRAGCVLATVVVLVAASYAPLLGLGTKATGSLVEYSIRWEFNSTPYRALHAATDRGLGIVGVPDAFEMPSAKRHGGPTTYYEGVGSDQTWVSRSELTALVLRVLAVGLLALLSVAPWLRRRSVPEASVVLLMTALLLSPVVHPWYLLWLLPAAAWCKNKPALAWCAIVPLAFWTPAAARDLGAWHEPHWIGAIEYTAVALAVALGAVRALGAREAERDEI